MSSNFPTLPTGPFEHVALDYARLRAEGIRLLGRLTSQQWTDFNAHDPGITILEQLCYAITDLAYRTAYPIQDLIAGAGAGQGLVPPVEILSCNPVTLTDLRKLALDHEGIENAWVDDEVEPELVFHYQEGGQFGFGPGGGQFDTGPVSLRGLHRVLLQPKPASAGSKEEVVVRFQASRGLGEDFQFATLGTFDVILEIEVDVGPIVDPQAVQTAIYDRISAYLTPPIRFITPSDARASGQRLEQIFEGPALSRGVLATLPEKRQVIYASDLIHVIMDVPEVRAVRSLELQGKSAWVLEVPAGEYARLNRISSTIRFHIGTGATGTKRAEASALAAPVPVQAPSSGRERGLGQYSSFQVQLPAAYGIGALGLAASAPAQRKAQVRQLQAYLLIFDQLLANAFAQLAHAHELLVPAADNEPTYFGQAIEDAQLQDLLDWSGGQIPHEHGIGVDGDRRKRFLAHLLARFGEHLGDDTTLANWIDFSPERQKNYLEQFPQLSAGRGSGANVLGWVADQDVTEGVSLFEQRIRMRLGLLEDVRFHVIEHVLLRPIAEDGNQVVPGEPNPLPLLDSDSPDPWSLQVSVVFGQPLDNDGEPNAVFKALVKQTLLAEMPAHLTVHLHFVDDGDAMEDAPSSWQALEAAWAAFREYYGEYRRALAEGSEVDTMLQLYLRDARDRLIEMLDLGLTYPLRDIPLKEDLFVPSATTTLVTLPFSQVGVTYMLIDVGDESTLTNQVVDGNGGEISLTTPVINDDLHCRVLAVKKGSSPARKAILLDRIWIQEGVDPNLPVQMAVQFQGTTFVAYGAQAKVEVHLAQANVEYWLHAGDPNVPWSAPVQAGEGDTIELITTNPVYEDIDLFVRGRLTVGQNDANDLELHVEVRVLPNMNLSVSLENGVVDYGSAPTVRIQNAQTSVRYEVWGRQLGSSEYVFVGDPPATLVPVQGNGEILLDLLGIELPVVALPDGQTLLAPSVPGEGVGVSTAVPFGTVFDDMILYVRARKTHLPGHLGEPACWFPNPLIQLVRPNNSPMAAGYDVLMVNGEATGQLSLVQGQPRVLYQLLAGNSEAVGPALYSRGGDPGPAVVRVPIDYEIAPIGYAPGFNLDSPLPEGTSLDVRVIKAITGITVELPGAFIIDVTPNFQYPSQVSAGSNFAIRIDPGEPEEIYLLAAGGSYSPWFVGNGDSLEIWNASIQQTTEFMVYVMRQSAGQARLTRRYTFTVEVI